MIARTFWRVSYFAVFFTEYLNFSWYYNLMEAIYCSVPGQSAILVSVYFMSFYLVCLTNSKHTCVHKNNNNNNNNKNNNKANRLNQKVKAVDGHFRRQYRCREICTLLFFSRLYITLCETYFHWSYFRSNLFTKL